MWFYLLIAGLAAIVVALIWAVLFRKDLRADQARDVDVYRAQLDELERDKARGVISEAEAERLRLEISRRLLEADKKSVQPSETEASNTPKSAAIALAAVVALVVFGGGAALYHQLGAAGMPDQPLTERKLAAQERYETRPTQLEAESDAPEHAANIPQEDLDLIQALRDTLETRPNDPVGHRLLAKNEARIGNFVAAREAQSRVVAIAGPEDATVDDLLLLAEIMVYGAEGYISPEAEAIFAEVLRRNENVPTARYYYGLMLAQTGRPDLAYDFWKPLPHTADPQMPWYDAVVQQLPEVAFLAGERYDAAAADAEMTANGPDQAAIEAAQAMDEDDRNAMIRDMVDRLTTRIDEEGGTAEDYAQLIISQTVLGDEALARETLAKARAEFSGDQAALDILADAERRARLDQ
ncbi:c-type cytochrome biogenesis protein CcmI [Halocynthiibacter sp. C4]|uniref:c-type cytochrome biogenesis protein CcmI n=1 Tax=Halocynthiibacter sp. C4 TaxID=2992758 RepID=UPI00237C2810|nr:c-type cytochrome biogenesis protein CcmI [Halocynthiibacter sp. C4]MDE0589950.1 c-type cytochrome biogenesis protein CcmI [Halocynthiibacter sp. C4]